MNSVSNFDDFLNLKQNDFSKAQLIVFTGISGSGKSTAIQYLLKQHPDFSNIQYHRISGYPVQWQKKYFHQWLVVDELTQLKDTYHLQRLLHHGHRLLVASHLPPALLKLATFKYRALYFQTDQDQKKLGRYLHQRGIRSSESTIANFVSMYGASYKDLDIMLERTQCDDFDVIYHRFSQQCQIRRTG